MFLFEIILKLSDANIGRPAKPGNRGISRFFVAANTTGRRKGYNCLSELKHSVPEYV